MKSLTLSLFLLLLSAGIRSQSLYVEDLTCEHKKDPVGIDVPQPRLSWKIRGEGNNILQSAYSVRVALNPRFSSSGILWESGKITSDGSVLQAYQGPALKSATKYYWQVRIWDNKGRVSKWSETATWETGLLSQEEWKAKWIEIEDDTNRYSPSPHFRKEFTVNKPILKPLYILPHMVYTKL